ncbi:PREDICTED: replication protein A 70 kDa DNA-binding subunit C-like [Camelina sativa]|uniref:Replication protein A 70 kDa DNA-binding subunit C-like n=1 Tax=Camelina sativa TaxID=90675 RepID=A0ABM1QHP3_CAMSA|nr:PREDICTED: replication protein A 70 kDa DNA-binding subunit C-like [Camelina sativa]
MASKQIIISPYVNINEINPALDHYKIRGTRVHASIEDALVKKFHNQINVGESKIIDTFSLVDYDGDYRTSALGFKMVFYRTTTFKPCDDFSVRVPEKYFQEFSTILAGKIDKQVLFDVVGQIAGVDSLDNVKTKGKENVKISFDLQDLSGDRLSCTIWGDLARTFEASIKEHENSVVVCVIRFACLKEWKGNYNVSNAFNTTYIHLNPSIPEVKKFRQMMPNTSVVELVQNEDEAKNRQPKLFVGKKDDELVSQIAEDDLNIMFVSLSALIGKTMLFKISITINNLKSDKGSYVVEKFWEKEDMVNQFVKETYRKVNDN